MMFVSVMMNDDVNVDVNFDVIEDVGNDDVDDTDDGVGYDNVENFIDDDEFFPCGQEISTIIRNVMSGFNITIVMVSFFLSHIIMVSLAVFL